MPVLMRGSVLGRIDGLERAIGSVEFEFVVGLMLGLMVVAWYMEMLAFLEIRSIVPQ